MSTSFSKGIAFGLGFTLILVAGLSLFLFVGVPWLLDDSPPDTLETTAEVEPAEEQRTFVGTHTAWSPDFRGSEAKLLSAGPGSIVGTALYNGSPVSGLKLRLALNNTHFTDWAVTSESGEYRLPVPYSSYRIDAFEFDRETLDRLLPGIMLHPDFIFWSKDVFDVANGKFGPGINFKFVDPVALIVDRSPLQAGEPITVEWEAYPGAASYRVQLYEKLTPGGQSATLFERNAQPTIEGTSLTLADYGIEVKSGHYYEVDILAFDADGRAVSRTGDWNKDYDFTVQ